MIDSVGYSILELVQWPRLAGQHSYRPFYKDLSPIIQKNLRPGSVRYDISYWLHTSHFDIDHGVNIPSIYISHIGTGTKWLPCFQTHLLVRILLYFVSNFNEICHKSSSSHWASICSNNDLTTSKWQTIVWTNGGLVYWRINASIHYGDVRMGPIASQITSLTIVYSTVYSDADQSKHQSSASLAFVRGLHRGPVNSPHKWPVTRKMFPFDDVIMRSRWVTHSVLCFQGFIHDAVLIWAYGVNRTIERGGAPDDGAGISNNSFNTNFDGVTGMVKYILITQVFPIMFPLKWFYSKCTNCTKSFVLNLCSVIFRRRIIYYFLWSYSWIHL